MDDILLVRNLLPKDDDLLNELIESIVVPWYMRAAVQNKEQTFLLPKKNERLPLMK
jgi:hypothetical protein